MNGTMDSREANVGSEQARQYQFCSLEYRQQGWGGASSRFRPIILLVLRDGEGNLRFLLHPELHLIVQKEDLEYIQSLLEDFLERAKREPAALFKQLSSLGVGSLVTQEVGSNLDDDSSLKELSSRFVAIE